MDQYPLEVFNNKTDEGHEPAFKRGQVVPDGAVGLAYVKSPALSPEKNIILIDYTASVAQDSLDSGDPENTLYFANSMGILQDINGNQLILDEYPIVSNVFLPDESLHDANDYSSSDILPYQHESRYFHVDFTSLDVTDTLFTYTSPHIKVVDINSHEYVDSTGRPLYKIKIIRPPQAKTQSLQTAYRLFAYVDSNALNQQLYLTYNKIEMDDDGSLTNNVFGYKEILNPRPYLMPQQLPLVVDPQYRGQRWFAPTPISLKNQILGLPAPSHDGYKVYVTQKAIPDPRIFQLFRWRLNCSFQNTYPVQTVDLFKVVTCGVVVTNSNPTSNTPYSFFNLETSGYNTQNIRFANPLWHEAGNADNEQAQETAAYWYVNFDTISDADLAKFDILIWSPSTPIFDFSSYAGRIDYFTRVLGKTLIIDSNDTCVISGLAGITASAPVGATATPTVYSPLSVGSGYAHVSTLTTASADTEDPFHQSSLGGYDFATGDTGTLTYLQLSSMPNFMQYISGYTGYTPIVTAKDNSAISVNSTIASSPAGFSIATASSSGAYQLSGGIFSPNLTVTSPQIPTGSLITQVTATLTINCNVPGTATSDELMGRTLSINADANVPSYLYSNNTAWFNKQVDLVDGIQIVKFDVTIPLILEATYAPITFTANTNINPLYMTSGNLVVVVTYGTDTAPVPLQLGDSVPVAVECTYPSNGRLVVSTASVLLTTNMVLNPYSPAIISDNNQSSIYQNQNYGDFINSVNAVGAYKLLYNFVLLATKNRSLTDGSTSFASSWQLSTPWQTSWTIDGNTLTTVEQNTYNFSYNYADVATPFLVWQRQLSPLTCKQLMDGTLTDDMANRIVGSSRTYTIEVTNTQVSVPVDLGDQSYPTAWTTAYTPELSIPPDLGAYVIQDETVTGSYSSGQYLYRTYPPKPYSVQVVATYIDTVTTNNVPVSTGGPSLTFDWTAVGTAQNTIANPILPAAGLATTGALSWASEGSQMTRIGAANPYQGVTCPQGIWVASSELPSSSQNYLTANSWPYIGITGSYKLSDSGEVVKFIQEALNRFQAARFITLPAGALNITGIFDLPTYENVVAFQEQLGALSEIGVVDAETLSLIGGQILRLGSNPGRIGTDYTKYFAYPAKFMQLNNISDGDNSTVWAKISNYTNSPSQVSESFLVQFAEPQTINQIVVTPYLEGAATSLKVVKLQIKSGANIVQSMDLNLVATQDQALSIQVNAVVGDSFIVTLLQDQPSGFGQSRFLGIRDAYAVGLLGANSTSPIVSQTSLYSIQDFQSVSINTSGQETVTAALPANSGGTLSSTNWTDIAISTGITQKGVLGEFPNMPVFWSNNILYDNFTGQLAYYGPNGEPGIFFDPTMTIPTGYNVWTMPDGRWAAYQSGVYNYPSTSTLAPNTPQGSPLVTATISASGTILFTPTAIGSQGNTFVSNTAFGATRLAKGQQLPDPSGSYLYFGSTIGREVSPIPEVGWVSKEDGIKLLCKADGSPAGFDLSVPSPAPGESFAFANYSLSTSGTDTTVVAGFYDLNVGEFILNGIGASNYELTYAEYQRRGPQNVFLAVATTYELDSSKPFPLDNDAAKIPFRWVMPVYGVTRHTGTKISLEQLPSNLDFSSVWPVTIRTGRFSTQIKLRPKVGASVAYSTGPYANYLKYYQTDQEVALTAFYSVPESRTSNPQLLVANEQPIVIADDHIQVRQPPILMLQQQTLMPSLADPVRPIFQVQVLKNGVWEVIGLSDIADYNINTGDIYLKTPVVAATSSKFKVNYSTTNASYKFKGYDMFNSLDLNPYSGTTQGIVGQPIFIYILPDHIVVNSVNRTIPQSVQTRAIRFTFDESIFDPYADAYDPTALLLGVVYVSAAMDVKDVIMIDARRRGGGIKDTLTDAQARQVAEEATSYWDIDYALGASYQKSGFALVRLPANISNDFTDDVIKRTITRNITAGVAFTFEKTLNP